MSDNAIARIHLAPEQFTSEEVVLVATDSLSASGFAYRSGVAGLRIRHAVGEIVILPFQGQQVWDATFHGRRLTMRSMFSEPRPTRDFLATYGAFFLHCGASAVGNPGPGDRHPLHGELPNAPYTDVAIAIGRDAAGDYMAIGGSHRHTVAFSHDYIAHPRLKIRPNSGVLELTMTIHNMKRSPGDFCYLAHVNFAPRDGARLLDSVPDTPVHMRVRAAMPDGSPEPETHRALVTKMRRDPSSHRDIQAGQSFDPELVLALDAAPGTDGWAHAMQLHPDGNADFVSHRPDELPRAVRWIARNADQDALGLLLPGTSEADGYTAEKAKGNVRILAPGGKFQCTLRFGALEPPAAATMAAAIDENRKLLGAC